MFEITTKPFQNTTNNQSVYGTNSALANTSSYSTSSSIPTNITSGQYNSYSTNAGSHKLSNKDSQVWKYSKALSYAATVY